jgi:hypothetical protein
MKSIVKYLLILVSIAIATSCLREPFELDDPCPCDDERNVMLKLGIPYIAPQPATRAIDGTQENTIETLDVLAFKVESGVETFQYWADAKKNAGNIEGAQTQSFTAKLRIKDYPQRFVLITNARSKIETLIAGVQNGEWIGTDKETMLGQLTVDLNGNDRWKAINASNYTAIPMWGETTPKVITSSTTSIDGSIPILRMIAKIEVELDVSDHPAVASEFKLKSVHVYNTNTTGRIVPKPGTAYVSTGMVAQKASLPASVTTVVGPLAYNDFAAPGLTDVAMKGAIYLFETAAKNAGNTLDETCIVVGGYYDGDQYETYDRLDFFVQNTETHMDILRNHRYLCKITEVHGRGYPTVDDAYRAKPSNMTVNIIVWDDSSIRDIIFDGEYMLGVSENPFELTGEAHTLACDDNILYVTTDYPTGFTYTVWSDKAGTTSAPWITNVTATYIGGQVYEMKLVMDANPGSSSRTAYIHIKAGRLIYIVEVIQNINVPNSITVTPDEMLLPFFITSYLKNSLFVNCRKPDGREASNQKWTLTVQAPATAWLRLSTDPATPFGSAQTSISGKGSQIIYVIATKNEYFQRTANIYLDNDLNDVRTIVTQMAPPFFDPGNGGAGTTPAGGHSYVGAFWRANQTGERIIRIDLGKNVDNYGAWTAQLMYLDDRWRTGDGVVLSLYKLPGMPGADPDIDAASPGDAEDYQVEGNSTLISYASINDRITFRIGLKSKYTPTPEYPARYAVILLSYNDNKKFHKIFLRQGEEPDYLFTKNDRIDGGMTSTERPYARKYSPFNVTATTLNVQLPFNGGKFADYPSQAGALFQWSAWTGRANVRMPWDPFTPSAPIPWAAEEPGFWDTLAATQEVSPTGYRRPTEGLINGFENSTNIGVSEVRQSLFRSPTTIYNYNSNEPNTLYGYYADGFFDRRSIATSASAIAKSVVASTTKDVAYIGRLYFNSIATSTNYNASLFFPATGVRNYTNGQLTDCGDEALYWTASANSTTEALCIRVSAISSGGWRALKGNAGPIRPVVHE